MNIELEFDVAAIVALSDTICPWVAETLFI